MGLENKVDEMVKKYMILPDIHYPEQDKKAIKVIEQVLQYWKPDAIVYLGDFMDMGSVSHWIQDKRRKVENKRLISDYTGFNFMLDKHAKLSKCKEIHLLKGNHEDWVEQYIDKHPETEGFLEVENNLVIPKGVKATFYQLNDFMKIGKYLYATHGLYTNQYHTRKTIDSTGRNIVYGHTHDMQVHTKVSPVDKKDIHQAVSLGCLCNMNPDYMKNKPNNWVHGFGAVYLDERSQHYNLQPVVIANGKCIFEGKVFK